MRKIFIILFLFVRLIVSANTYYVSTTGTDGAYPTRGTFTNPWKTWHYAFNNTTSGDTCYFRGGIYAPYSNTVGVQLHDNSQDGTYSHPTCFFAYPADFAAGNYPVMDCQTMTSYPNNFGISLIDCHNLYIKGLTIKNVRQITDEFCGAVGIVLWNNGYSYGHAPNNIRFENCTTHHIGGHGFQIYACDTTYFINCDAHDICDTLNFTGDAGGRGTGFGFYQGTYLSGDSSYVYAHGNRAWRCSDQGFSAVTQSKLVYDSCWSVNTGYTSLGVSKGSGWKMWYYKTGVKNINVLQITIRNCLAVDNGLYGISWSNDASHPEIRCHIYNNFCYRNGKTHPNGGRWGFGFLDENNSDTTGRWDHWYWNNISYNNWGEYGTYDKIPGITNEATNKFDLRPTTISDADFESLDTTGLCGARQANGKLPVINFGHLAPDSECINAGTEVGLPHSGTAPDIGWAEYEEGTPITDPLNSTITPYNVNTRQGICGGIVTSDGGGTISARGICWATHLNPNLTDNIITVAGTTGTFTTTITGLSASTTYHVQSYATNEHSTYYGGDVEFTTPKFGIGWYGGKAAWYKTTEKIVIVK